VVAYIQSLGMLKFYLQIQSQIQNTLFNLGMVTYSYERQDIIQFALKRLPGG
jgi:hypothetical protein